MSINDLFKCWRNALKHSTKQMQSKEQVTKRIWEKTFLNFSKTKCEINGKFKGKCPLGVLIYISVDLRKGQGRAKDMGTPSVYIWC